MHAPGKLAPTVERLCQGIQRDLGVDSMNLTPPSTPLLGAAHVGDTAFFLTHTAQEMQLQCFSENKPPVTRPHFASMGFEPTRPASGQCPLHHMPSSFDRALPHVLKDIEIVQQIS